MGQVEQQQNRIWLTDDWLPRPPQRPPRPRHCLLGVCVSGVWCGVSACYGVDLYARRFDVIEDVIEIQIFDF